MAARSSGLWPREGFNLDAEMQVPENAGGNTALLGDLSKAKTIRVILVNPLVTGDAQIVVDFDTLNSVQLVFDVNTPYEGGSGTLILGHVRGALLDGKTQDVAYQLVQNTGAATVDAVYLELVDGVRR